MSMGRKARMEESMEDHPTAWRPQPGLLRSRMAELLAGEGASHPEVGSWALAARGSLGVDRPFFAALFDVDEELVASLEAGGVDLARVPPALQRLVRSYGEAQT